MGLWDFWHGRLNGWQSANDRDFIEMLYGIILDRRPDSSGLEHHLQNLQDGRVTRDGLVRAFILSSECRYRLGIKYAFHELLGPSRIVAEAAPFKPYVKKDPFIGSRLCELANPYKWVDEAWRAVLVEMDMLSPSLDEVHRKTYEFVQTVYGLRALGAIEEEVRVLGVGAGHESLLYWLANRVKEVVATDLYQGSWTKRGSREGDAAVLIDPAKYAPFPFREDHLKFLRMDGRNLEFADCSFEVVYSLSAIEHFGGHEGAAQAMKEMGRVLKPGGVAAVATELILNGRSHQEFFLPADLLQYVVKPSNMVLVQEPIFTMPVHALKNPLELPGEKEHRPHLVLKQKGVEYTSVMLFFTKPSG